MVIYLIVALNNTPFELIGCAYNIDEVLAWYRAHNPLSKEEEDAFLRNLIADFNKKVFTRFRDDGIYGVQKVFLYDIGTWNGQKS
jgi:hypothetical protein